MRRFYAMLIDSVGRVMIRYMLNADINKHPQEICDYVMDIVGSMPCHEPRVIALHRHPAALADYMIVVGAFSTPHVKAIAHNISVGMKKHGHPPISIEGIEKETGWVIVDLDSTIVHVMLEDARSFYRLEDLWSKIPEEQQEEETGTYPHPEECLISDSPPKVTNNIE